MNSGKRSKVHGTKWFKETYGVSFSVHDGKMTEIPSLSTSCTENSRCQFYSTKCPGSICTECFARKYQGFRKSLRDAMVRNGIALRSGLLPELPFINAAYARIESFGDVDEGEKGLIQTRNYLRIAKYNKQTGFAWFTKNPDVVAEGISIEGRPKNVCFMASSIYVNKVRDVSRYPWVDGVFTVWDPKYLAAHPEIKINCGSRQCLGCLRCYKRHKNLIYVNEVLK